MTVRDIVILGSTGSIGTQALDLVRANPDRFRVVGLTAGGSNPELFEAQVAEFAPAFSGLGEEASTEAAGRECDVVLNGITGAVGLRPTLAALDAGTTLALANKESLIMGGSLVTDRARPGQIVPVDSEHSALAQCLRAGAPGDVRRLVLTASGGPFRGRTRDDLAEVTVEEALAAPDVVDGAGHHDQLRHAGQQGPRGHRGAPALRHPVRPDRGRRAPHQRRALDGRVRRRLDDPAGQPADDDDPDRARPRAGPTGSPTPLPPSTGARPATWEFFPLDDEAFPAVSLARTAGELGGTAPAVYNAANEACVEAFRAGRLGFVDIIPTVDAVLAAHDVRSGADLTVDDVLAADAWARAEASSSIAASIAPKHDQKDASA